MRMTTRAAMFVLLLSAIAAPLLQAEEASSVAATASAPAQAAQALSLQKARELALVKSASLKKAALAVDAASLTKRAQDYEYLPSLAASASASAGYGSSATLADSLAASAKLSASATVFDGGKNAALSKKYDIATEAARESLRALRVSVIGSVDSAFFAVLEAEASMDAASSDLDAARLRLKIAQAKVDAGALSKADYLETESATASYEATLIKARKSLASAKAKLGSLTGLAASTEPEQVDFASYDGLLAKLAALDEAALDKLVADLVAAAKANSPSLASYALVTGQADASLAAARAAYLPTVSAAFAQSFALGSGGLDPTGSLTLSASLSLDLWTTQNAIEQAKVTVREAELDAAGGSDSLELDVSQAAYEWVASALAIPSSAKALEYAQTNYENVLQKYKLSSATTSDLSTAEALVSADKTALISARYTFLSDLSSLKGLLGLEDEAKILAALP
jgi:outer membrane protein TolC